MHDPQPVRGIQRVQNLARILHRPLGRQRSLQWLAFDILHHEVIGADVVQRADVRVIQRSDGACFRLESRAVFGLQPLDGDDPIEVCVAGLPALGLAA